MAQATGSPASQVHDQNAPPSMVNFQCDAQHQLQHHVTVQMDLVRMNQHVGDETPDLDPCVLLFKLKNAEQAGPGVFEYHVLQEGDQKYHPWNVRGSKCLFWVWNNVGVPVESLLQKSTVLSIQQQYFIRAGHFVCVLYKE
jgi:hypothetical protein